MCCPRTLVSDLLTSCRFTHGKVLSIRDERVEFDYPIGFISGWTFYVRAVLRVTLSDFFGTYFLWVGSERTGNITVEPRKRGFCFL